MNLTTDELRLLIDAATEGLSNIQGRRHQATREAIARASIEANKIEAENQAYTLGGCVCHTGRHTYCHQHGPTV